MAFDPWLDPNLIDCSCRKCQRGGRCSDMQQVHDVQAEGQQGLAREAALTSEDKSWLRRHGWKK